MPRLNLAARYFATLFACMQISAYAMAAPVDAALQRAATEAMAARRGTAVVLEVGSGRLLAAYHLDVAARRVVAPGSSIKPFTLMALLESGKVSGQTALMCKRSLSIAGHKLDCTHPKTAQPLGPSAALAYSCNSYFSRVVLRLTPTQLRNSLMQDGFASVTSVARNEATGKVALAQLPEEVQLQALGEWGIDVTPLEMVRAYRRVALLQSEHNPNLEPLFAGLKQSVTYGMGYAAQPARSMAVAGKTGTAPAREGPWTYAWFAGYAPAENPAIALVVFLEKGHGGSEAAEVAREIFTAFADWQKAKAGQATGATR
jgi:cell division protein FtsI/penicillin-binding protein 2